MVRALPRINSKPGRTFSSLPFPVKHLSAEKDREHRQLAQNQNRRQRLRRINFPKRHTRRAFPQQTQKGYLVGSFNSFPEVSAKPKLTQVREEMGALTTRQRETRKEEASLTGPSGVEIRERTRQDRLDAPFPEDGQKRPGAFPRSSLIA